MKADGTALARRLLPRPPLLQRQHRSDAIALLNGEEVDADENGKVVTVTMAVRQALKQSQ